MCAGATNLQHIRGSDVTSRCWKDVLVMLYSHFSVALLCLNVMFDLLVFGLPVFLLNAIGLLPNKACLAITTRILNWTTPTVFTMPMLLSGSTVYCNDVDLLIKSKESNSLLLANHGSVSDNDSCH